MVEKRRNVARELAAAADEGLVESLVADSALSDPRTLLDEDLADAMQRLEAEEHTISSDRKTVLGIHDVLQEELKRRFKENPAEALAP